MREYENTQVAPKRKVTALDGLRVLAIIGVVVYHANPSWLPGGFLGVTVFFVISGYVITSSVLKELQNNDAIDFKAYICKRVRRLWPTMLIVVLATALLSAIFAPALLQKMQPDVLPALAFRQLVVSHSEFVILFCIGAAVASYSLLVCGCNHAVLYCVAACDAVGVEAFALQTSAGHCGCNFDVCVGRFDDIHA